MTSVFSPPDYFYKVVDGLLYQTSSGWGRSERQPTLEDTFRLVPNSNSKLKDGPLIKTLISHIHESLGHLGRKKCHKLVKQYTYWIGIEKNILNLCASCMKCQSNKSSNLLPVGCLQPLPILSASLRSYCHVFSWSSAEIYTVWMNIRHNPGYHR